MNKLLIIDRDGTIIAEPQDNYQVDRLDKLEFCPDAVEYLSRIAAECDYELLMVTNQDGLGTAAFAEEKFWPAHNMMLKTLKKAGVIFKEVLIDRSFPTEFSLTRKPRTGLLKSYMTGRHNLMASFVIGDRLTDMELARNLCCRGILYGARSENLGWRHGSSRCLVDSVALEARTWRDICTYLKNQP